MAFRQLAKCEEMTLMMKPLQTVSITLKLKQAQNTTMPTAINS